MQNLDLKSKELMEGIRQKEEQEKDIAFFCNIHFI